MLITLNIPKDAKIIAEEGEKINIGDELYHIEKKKEIKINIAQVLNIKPELIFQHLAKLIGEEVKKNEILAFKKGFLSTEKIYSDYQGVLKEINHNSGEITILMIDKNSKRIVKSYFKAVINKIANNCLIIEITDAHKINFDQIPTEGGGELFYFLNNNSYFNIFEDNIKNRVVLIEELTPRVKIKCEALEAGGFIFCRKKTDSNFFSTTDNLIFSTQIKSEDYRKLINLKKRYIIFSTIDKIGIVYD